MVVGLAEEAVAVPVGALVRHLRLELAASGAGCPAWVCTLTRKALDLLRKLVVPAIVAGQILLAARPIKVA